MTAFSILDLAHVVEGSTPAEALANSLDLARHAETLGYRRFWLAEHHNMVGIASAATAVVIGHVAGGTKTIRVGSGGIMLPNHAPLVIAEQFGTLASLYPGRIDLGLGRAPGTDQRTLRALRRDPAARRQLPAGRPGAAGAARPAAARTSSSRPCPARARNVPLWILGSSLFGAQLAAMLGLPYAFASHFAPDALMQALEIYRAQLPAVGAARQALCHGRRQRHRRRHGCRGATPLHLGRSRRSPTCSAARAAGCRRRSTISRPIGRRREGPGLEHARLSFVGSAATVRRASSVRRGDRTPTSSSSRRRSTIMGRGCAPTRSWPRWPQPWGGRRRSPDASFPELSQSRCRDRRGSLVLGSLMQQEIVMSYVDGYVVAVPKAILDA